MDYELAKKLKDAGFKGRYVQTYGCKHPDNDGRFNQGGKGHSYKFDCDSCPFPTLEELIEACGYHFHTLQRVPPVGSYKQETSFNAASQFPTIIHSGKTPRVAVANLYLALKEKSKSSKDIEVL